MKIRRSINYEKYLTSGQWKEKRLIALERAQHKCQLCNSSVRLEVHHRTYEHLGDELPEDLTVLCADCHRAHSRRMSRKKHKKLTLVQKEKKKVAQNMLNGKDPARNKQYFNQLRRLR